jgi:hypothetical protein
MEQNLAIYEEIVGQGKVYGEEIENYKKMLEEDVVSENDYEPAFGEENPFIENNVNKVAPVSAPSQINAPTVEINKK